MSKLPQKVNIIISPPQVNYYYYGLVRPSKIKMGVPTHVIGLWG